MRRFFSVLSFLLIICNYSFSQLKVVDDSAIPYCDKAENCMWLSNLKAEEVLSLYLSNTEHKLLKVSELKDITSYGYHLYYKKDNLQKVQKYSVKITTLREDECLAYYEKHNPEVIKVIFSDLKDQVGSNGHTYLDYKKIYHQYKHLGCRLYKQIQDGEGNLTDEMSFLLKKYQKADVQNQDNYLATTGIMDFGLIKKKPLADKWNYWITFLKELETKGYITLIEYSEAP